MTVLERDATSCFVRTYLRAPDRLQVWRREPEPELLLRTIYMSTTQPRSYGSTVVRLPTGRWSGAWTSAEDVSLFQELAALWRADTAFTSSIDQMVLHPAYQQIVGMGERAVPVLLRELQENPDHWFWALRAITRSDPVAQQDRGDVDTMAAAWVSWGRERGYID